ncbi:MAG: hypothetical protein LC113_10680 [Acidobacteria bacterium]|nr:hypothetical protein [Acidobacteriota bacterium]
MRINPIAFCLSLFILSAATMAQGERTQNHGTRMTSSDVRIVKSKPHVYVGFVRQGRIAPLYEGEGHERLWLRFFNNSRFGVMLCANPIPKEYGEIYVRYEVERYRGAGRVPGVRRSDSCNYIVLAPGDRVIFSIPREHLEEGLAVKIGYRYEWETDPDGAENTGEPKHYTLFYASDIPLE